MKRLLEIDDEYDFSLLGISCHAKDYRLCWELNRTLNLQLAKYKSIKSALKPDEKFSTSIFDDEENLLEYTLISNKNNGKYLIPEYPQLDYFLKLSGPQHDFEIKEQKQKVQSLDLVLTVLQINPTSLKSGPNLVF